MGLWRVIWTLHVMQEKNQECRIRTYDLTREKHFKSIALPLDIRLTEKILLTNETIKKRQGGNIQAFQSFPESIFIDRRAFISIEKYQKPSF